MNRQRGWRLLLSLGILLVVLGHGSLAEAWPRYNPNTWVTPVYRSSFFSFSAATYSFETTNLQPPPFPVSPSACLLPDTFMVVQPPFGAAVVNDNCTPSEKRSCLSNVSSPVGGLWKVTVFAATQASCGRTDVKRNGTTIASGVGFGGVIFNLPYWWPNGEYQSFNTVHVPGGSTDTWMIHFSSTWAEKGYDDDGGPGKAARLWSQKASGDRLLVGSWNWSNYGNTNVIINQCRFTPDHSQAEAAACNVPPYYRDQDNDNLSAELEAELLTDSVAPNGHDSDGDGIYDYFEVLGRQLPSGEEDELVLRGANPRRRDLFLEIDYRDNWAPLPKVTEYIVQGLEAYFTLAKHWPANRDGTNGIKFHVDTGPSPQGCVGTTLCGNWGGSSVHAFDTDVDTIQFDHIKSQLLMNPVRWGTHQWAYLGQPTSGMCANPGSSLLSRMSFWHCSNSGAQVNILAHELGHSLGLDHHGDADLPYQLNNKLNYRSVMNYSFQDGYPSGGLFYEFSSGDFDPIDNLNLDEMEWSKNLYKNDFDDVYDYCPDQVGQELHIDGDGDKMDWNLDGRHTAGGVRFDVSPQGMTPGGSWEYRFGISSMGSDVFPLSGGMGMAAAGPEVYAFAHRLGSIYFRKTVSTSGGWSSWQPLGQSWTPGAGDTSAGAMFSGNNAIILVVHPGTNSQLYYALFDVGTQAVIAEGPIPGWPAGAVARDATVANVGTKLAIAFRNDVAVGLATNSVWYTRVSTALSFDGWTELAQLGNPVKSAATPAVIHGSDDKEYLVTSRVNEPTTYTIHDRWANQTTAEFVEVGARLSAPVGYPGSQRRINGLFLPYLTAAGVPFADGSGYLAVFANWNNGTSSPNWARMYTGPIGPTIGPARFASSNPPLWRAVGCTSDFAVEPSQAIAAVRRGSEAMVAYGAKIPIFGANSIIQVAYPTGLAPGPTKHTDHADAPKMAQTLCKSVWSLVCTRKCTDPLWFGACDDPVAEATQCGGQP